MRIHSLWIKGHLSILNRLCVKSFQEHGHEMIIYSYDKTIDPGCEVVDANRILNEKEIFYYKNFKETHKFGGIAERLKAEMLYQLGGWHVDLDVVCLRAFIFAENYVLRPHPNERIVGNIIKAPQGCQLAQKYVEWTKTIDENNTDWEKSFLGLTYAVYSLGLYKYIVDKRIFGTDEQIWWAPLLTKRDIAPNSDRFAIHFCGALQYYENYIQGSFYESLLKKYKLI